MGLENSKRDGRRMKSMDNKVKQEMETIDIPDEVQLRSNLGIQKAFSEKKRTSFFNNKWIRIAAILLVVLVTGMTTTAGGYIKMRTMPLFFKITETEKGLFYYKKVATATLDDLKTHLNKEEMIYVTITLNRPISLEEYKTFIEKNDINARMSIFRMVEKSGLRGTGTLPGGFDGDFNEEYIQKHLSDMEKRLDSSFKGIIEIVGYVKVKNVDGLKQDPQIFLIDPSLDPHIVPNRTEDYMPGVYWELEKYNIVTE